MIGNLFLVRHGESQGIKPQGSDLGRELTTMGIRQIEYLRDTLFEEIIQCPEIVCSAAKRAFDTASIISKRWNSVPKIDTSIYYGGMDNYLNCIEKNFSSGKNLILVGHNPDISLFTSDLTGVDTRFLPGSCAVIELKNIQEKYTGKLLIMKHPKTDFNHE